MTTRSSEVYDRLRDDLLRGRYAPGSQLRFTDLASSYETSMSTLREAMTRLVERGLIVGRPQRGFRVTDLTPTEIEDFTQARRDIESLVLRQAILDGDTAWEARAVAGHHTLSRLEPTQGAEFNEAWVVAHADFHAALLSGCSNEWLLKIAKQLRDVAELLRRWSDPAELGKRDIAQEHRELLEASIERDTNRALELLARHVTHTIPTRSLAGFSWTSSRDD